MCTFFLTLSITASKGKMSLPSFVKSYVTLLEESRVEVGINYQNDPSVIPRYYRAPNPGVVEPKRVSSCLGGPVLIKTNLLARSLSSNHWHSSLSHFH